MSTAVTPPTPENVAQMLTEGDNDYHDGNYWRSSITADGNVVRLTITPDDEDGNECPDVAFRAVVVEGSEVPIVLQRPAEPGDLRPDAGPHLDWRPGFVHIGDDDRPFTPAEARLYAAHIAALADLAERRADQ